ELVGLVCDRVLGVPGAALAAGLLDVEEREVALSPLLAPAADQGAHQRVLVDAEDGRAALALVPQDAADAEGDHAADVGLVQAADLAAGLARLLGRRRLRRRRLAVLLRRLGRLLPGCQRRLVLLLLGVQVVRRGELLDRLLAPLVGVVRLLAQP